MADETSALNQTISLLSSAVGDLRVTVAELKVTVAAAADRDREDRVQSAGYEVRLSALERWRSRVNGQITLIAFVAGGTAVGLSAAVIRHFFP